MLVLNKVRAITALSDARTKQGYTVSVQTVKYLLLFKCTLRK